LRSIIIWTEQHTTTHQDHVIAHVIGTRVIGYFVFDESIYLVLDIGFIWQIYLNAEMGLLPCSVAIRELIAGEEFKEQLSKDCDLLLAQSPGDKPLERMTAVPVDCLIQDVNVFADDESNSLRLVLNGEDDDLFVECSLSTRAIVLRAKEQAPPLD